MYGTDRKIMLAIGEKNYTILVEESKYRNISLQELLRAVVIPDWIRGQKIG